MKILHVVYDFSPGRYPGGVPKVVYELASQQVKDDHRVSIFTPQLLGGTLGATSEAITTEEGFTVYTPNSLGGMNSSACLQSLAANYDVLHSHNTYLSLNRDAVVAARRARVPICFHAHGALDPVAVNMGVLKALKKRAYIRLVERRNLNQAQCVFALTENEKRQIARWGVTSEIVVVPNGIARFIEPTSAERGSFLLRHPELSSAEIVLYLGRVNSKKAIEILIDAFGRIASKFPHTKLVIAGDKDEHLEYTRRLEARIKELALDARVVWAGFVDENEKRSLLKLATVFSHATHSEGMAISVLEAMAAKLPTVVSPGCYMNQAVADGALVCADVEAGSLAREISLLLADSGARSELARKAACYVEKHHDWKVISGEITRHYANARDTSSELV